MSTSTFVRNYSAFISLFET